MFRGLTAGQSTFPGSKRTLSSLSLIEWALHSVDCSLIRHNGCYLYVWLKVLRIGEIYRLTDLTYQIKAQRMMDDYGEDDANADGTKVYYNMFTGENHAELSSTYHCTTLMPANGDDEQANSSITPQDRRIYSLKGQSKRGTFKLQQVPGIPPTTIL